MRDLLRRRAFLLAGGVFALYGMVATGKDLGAEAWRVPSADLPGVNARFLRLRAEGEVLPTGADPFGLGELEFIPDVVPDVVPDDPVLPDLPPLLGAVPPIQMPFPVSPTPTDPVDEGPNLFTWPQDTLLTLNGTMSAGPDSSARLNGELLRIGECLVLAGQRIVLVRVEGSSAVLKWRGREFRLDLVDSPQAGPTDLPKDD